jgi:hypothetical protein
MKKHNGLKVLCLVSGKCAGCGDRLRKIDINSETCGMGLCLDCDQMMASMIGDDIAIKELAEI